MPLNAMHHHRFFSFTQLGSRPVPVATCSRIKGDEGAAEILMASDPRERMRPPTPLRQCTGPRSFRCSSYVLLRSASYTKGVLRRLTGLTIFMASPMVSTLLNTGLICTFCCTSCPAATWLLAKRSCTLATASGRVAGDWEATLMDNWKGSWRRDPAR